MSLSLTLNNALTGLRASSKQAETISNNVSNSLTEGYGRRDVTLSAATAGGEGVGVRVGGITRSASPFLAEAKRMAEAELGRADTLVDARSRLSGAIGEPGAPGALATNADRLDAAMAAAAESPESSAQLGSAVTAAKDYTASINRIAVEAMSLRSSADASIARQVNTINTTLTKLQSLNAEIAGRSAVGADISGLEDQREQLIQQVSSMIPVKVVKRSNDQVALYAKNGGQLLDGKVYELEFTPTPIVTPDKSIEGGQLSGITVAGREVRIGKSDGSGLLDGGSLSAAFEVRDVIAPAVAKDMDALAADLILRTQGLADDPTLAPGDAGLFTDDNAAFNLADTTGIALRLSVNEAVDPDVGGEVSRLRDGIGAVTPGETGQASVLRGIQDALREPVAVPLGLGITGSRGTAGFAAEMSSAALVQVDAAEEEAVFRGGRADALLDAERAEVGVDTDQELSRLLVVERTYAANARVIEVVDQLLARLMQL